MLSQIIYEGYEIGEITCPTNYFEDGSSINIKRSITYGFGVIWVSINHFLNKIGLSKSELYNNQKI